MRGAFMAAAAARRKQASARNDGEPDESGEDIGRELFRLVAKARELGRDPEMELREAARRYRDRVQAWERS